MPPRKPQDNIYFLEELYDDWLRYRYLRSAAKYDDTRRLRDELGWLPNPPAHLCLPQKLADASFTSTEHGFMLLVTDSHSFAEPVTEVSSCVTRLPPVMTHC